MEFDGVRFEDAEGQGGDYCSAVVGGGGGGDCAGVLFELLRAMYLLLLLFLIVLLLCMTITNLLHYLPEPHPLL